MTSKTLRLLYQPSNNVFLIFLLVFAGCVGIRKEIQISDRKHLEYVKVLAERENIRKTPNGEKIGSVELGTVLELIEQRGKWCKVYVEKDSINAWIWAESVGRPSFDIINVNSIAGSGAIKTDSLFRLIGSSTRTRKLGGNVSELIYNNELPGNGTLFGSNIITEFRLRVDNDADELIGIEYDLPQFIGTASELLDMLGLRDRKSTHSDFESVRYEKCFQGIYLVELIRDERDFNKFSRVIVFRKDPDKWRKYVSISKKEAKLDDSGLRVIITLNNNSISDYFTSPYVKIIMLDSNNQIGTWEMGPGDIRLNPGGEGEVTFLIPTDTSILKPENLSMKVELISLVVL